MERSKVIAELKKFFSLQELVCSHTYTMKGENSWNFLDSRLLETLLVIRRDILKVGLVINDYKFGGSNTQRGLRCNICPIVKSKTNQGTNYLTQHGFGKAVDIVSKYMTAEEMRKKIKANANLLPYPIRIEKDVTWLHVDVLDDGKGNKITEFRG